MPAFNYLTEEGAKIIASNVSKYWRDRNELVDVWTEPMPMPHSAAASPEIVWVVRSNMIDGKPAQLMGRR
jgi:hypothetical protein